MKTFKEADILLPGKEVNMEKWSVIACDQFTSEPEYWEEVKKFAGDSPSTLDMILPEVYLEQENHEEQLKNIEASMNKKYFFYKSNGSNGSRKNSSQSGDS